MVMNSALYPGAQTDSNQRTLLMMAAENGLYELASMCSLVESYPIIFIKKYNLQHNNILYCSQSGS